LKFGLAVVFAAVSALKAQCAVVVDGIEVVQTVQDLNSPVPIISGKPTLVRAFVHSTSGRLGLHADLAVDGGQGGASGTISSTAEVIVTPGADVANKRLKMSATLNFLLPNPMLGPGVKTLTLTHLTDGQHAPVECANCSTFKASATFLQGPPLHVHVLLVSYTYGANHAVASPRQIDVVSLRSWLSRAFPTGNVVVDTAPFASTDPWPFTCTQLNTQLVVARGRDMQSRSADQHTHYLAMVPNTDRLMAGCAFVVPDDPNPAVVASAPSGPPRGRPEQLPINVKNETDASFAGWYGGHELMHTLGRAHPGICNQLDDDDSFPAYARPEGQISPRHPVSVFGYDIGATPGGTHLLSGLTAHDIMTYCNQPDWPSPYTYEAVFARLQAESALSLSAGGPIASLAGPPTQATGPSSAGPPAATEATPNAHAPSGDPSVKPNADTLKLAARDAFVAVQAIVNLSRGSAELKFVNQSSRGPISTKPPAAGKPTAELKFITDTGEVISSAVVTINPPSDSELGSDKLGVINGTVSEPPGAAKIELWFNGRKADSRTIFNTQPLVKKVAATGGPGTTPTIQWNFVNPGTGAKISYDVQTSQNGFIWSTYMVGLQDNHLTLTPELAKIPWFRVIANDGVHNSDPVVVKHPPIQAAAGTKP
jgi:hypothetical protein